METASLAQNRRFRQSTPDSGEAIEMLISQADKEPASAEVEAYRHILKRIRLGELGPGARVRTEDIAAEVGMSRQPVREAIRRLQAEGYIVARPNRGAMVSQHSPEQLLELFEIRSVLEGLAARIATERLQAGDFAQIEALMARMTEAEHDTNTWLARHSEFHLHLASLSARPRLTQEIARLHAALEPYLRLWFVRHGAPANTRQDHAKVVEALRSGYPGHAEQVMRDHVLETAPELIDYLAATGQAARSDAATT